MSDPAEVDLYSRAEKEVLRVLLRYRRLRTSSNRTPGIRLDPMQSSRAPADRTVPSDSRCWLLDVEMALRALETPGPSFVHPHASALLLGDLVEGIRRREMAILTGVPSRQIEAIVISAVENFFALYVGVAVEYQAA